MSKHNARCLHEFLTGTAGILAIGVVVSAFAFWGLDAPLIIPLVVIVITALMIVVGVGAVTMMDNGEERQLSAELDNATIHFTCSTRGARKIEALAGEGTSRIEAHR